MAEACCQVKECPKEWRCHSHSPRAREHSELQLNGQRIQDSGADIVLKGLFASEPDASTSLHDDSVTDHTPTRMVHVVHVTARAPRLVEGDVQQLLFQSLDGAEVVPKTLHGDISHYVEDSSETQEHCLVVDVSGFWVANRHCCDGNTNRLREAKRNQRARPGKRRPDRQLLLATLPTLQEGCELEQTPQAFRPRWIPQHQHLVGLLQEASQTLVAGPVGPKSAHISDIQFGIRPKE